MANEKRLIDADALLEKLSRMIDYCQDNKLEDEMSALFQVGDAVMDCPTVDAVEVVHGYWIEHEYAEEENGLLVSNYECSACHSWERDEGYYCPNCGAKMDGDGNA